MKRAVYILSVIIIIASVMLLAAADKFLSLKSYFGSASFLLMLPFAGILFSMKGSFFKLIYMHGLAVITGVIIYEVTGDMADGSTFIFFCILLMSAAVFFKHFKIKRRIYFILMYGAMALFAGYMIYYLEKNSYFSYLINYNPVLRVFRLFINYNNMTAVIFYALIVIASVFLFSFKFKWIKEIEEKENDAEEMPGDIMGRMIRKFILPEDSSEPDIPEYDKYNDFVSYKVKNSEGFTGSDEEAHERIRELGSSVSSESLFRAARIIFDYIKENGESDGRKYYKPFRYIFRRLSELIFFSPKRLRYFFWDLRRLFKMRPRIVPITVKKGWEIAGKGMEMFFRELNKNKDIDEDCFLFAAAEMISLKGIKRLDYAKHTLKLFVLHFTAKQKQITSSTVVGLLYIYKICPVEERKDFLKLIKPLEADIIMSGKELLKGLSVSTGSNALHEFFEKNAGSIGDGELLRGAFAECGKTFNTADLEQSVLYLINISIAMLCGKDKQILRDIIKNIFEESCNYMLAANFDRKLAILSKIENKVRDIIISIILEPTYAAFYIFLEHLNGDGYNLLSRVCDEKEKLYLNSAPDIKIESMADKVTPVNRIVKVPVRLFNKAGCQTAAAIEFTSDSWYIDYAVHDMGKIPDIKLAENQKLSYELMGGETYETEIMLELSDYFDDLLSFEACLGIKYTFFISDSKTEVKEIRKIFYFLLEDFKQIANPFERFRKKTMTDSDMFFGREELLNRLSAGFFDGGVVSRGRGVAIYGATRSGKSSVKLFLAKKIESLENPPVVVDIGNVSSVSNFKEFLKKTADVCIKALGDDLPEEYKDYGRKIKEADASQSTMLFDDFCMKLTNFFAEQKIDRSVIIFIDEFTSIKNKIDSGAYPANFMDWLKALLENYGFNVFLVGQDGLPDFIKSAKNGFGAINIFKPPLSYLDGQAALELIKVPLKRANANNNIYKDLDIIENSAADYIYELTGGSAFLIIILCTELVFYMNSKKQLQATKSFVKRFVIQYLFENIIDEEEDFEPQLGDRIAENKMQADFFAERNKEVLSEIARNADALGYADASRLDTDIFEHINSRGELESVINRLVVRKVLEEDRRVKGRYKIVAGLLHEWLLFIAGEENIKDEEN